MAERTMDFNAKGEERKRLVRAISEFMETPAEYAGAPTFAFTVGCATIDRDGLVSFDDRFESGDIEGLLEYLAAKGFVTGGTAPEEEEETAEEAESGETEEEAPATQEEPEDGIDDSLTIEVPREGFTEEALSNLRKMVEGRASLLKKSIGTEELPIEVTEDRVRFPWFHDPDPVKVRAYTRLISAICKSAKEAKRVTVTDRDVESEKYAFRTWLIRLGFIGKEFKDDRAVLMANLSGTAAFKNAEDARAFAEKQKAKKQAAQAALETEQEAE